MAEFTYRHARHGVFMLCLLFATIGSATGQGDRPEAPPEEKPAQTPAKTPTGDEPRVTGIGGLFFKAEHSKELAEWYRKHLGITKSETGHLGFTWRDRARPERVGYTAWGAFTHDTTYFDPSDKTFMFNYRVNDLDGLLTRLEAEGVEIVGEIQRTDYGDFGWILDPEGTKIELWEAVDLVVPVDEKRLPGEVIDPNDAKVRAVLKDYYEDFSARDWEKFAANFHDGAILSSVWLPPDVEAPRVNVSTIPDFVARARQGTSPMPIFDVRMTAVAVELHGHLAQAWAHYDTTIGEEDNLIHSSGIDAFTLLKIEGAWRIVSLAYVPLEGE